MSPMTAEAPPPEAASRSDGGAKPVRRGIGKSIFALFSSFGLACVILLFLMALTFRGTYEQVDIGTMGAQKKYFDTLFWTYDLGPVAIPMPGAYLLLCLLAVNLVCGGFIRLKWSKRTVGILITHVGILLILLSGIVTFHVAKKGIVRLEEGQTGSIARDFHLWEIAIGEPLGDGTIREHLIEDERLRTGATLRSKALPFELLVRRYYPNCTPRVARTLSASDAVDGVYLSEVESNPKMRDLPGVYLDAVLAGGKVERGILWGLQEHPWTVRVDGVPWTIDLRQRVYDLPFAVRLEKFDVEYHPGTSRPRLFRSRVTRFDLDEGSATIAAGDEGTRYDIVMNQPMRHRGHILSQNDWGPKDNERGPTYTILEMTVNPVEQWPMYCTFVIGLGLLFHFVRKLIVHVEKQHKKRMA